MARSQSNFEILGGEVFICNDATDALVGQPSLRSAVDFEAFYKEKHKYPTIREVGVTYPSYFVDEDKCTYFLDPIPELEQCRDIYGDSAINSNRWSKVAIRHLKNQFANKVKKNPSYSNFVVFVSHLYNADDISVVYRQVGIQSLYKQEYFEQNKRSK